MGLAVAVRMDYIDNKGKTSSSKIRIPTGFSIAQYIEFAQAAAQAKLDMSDCQITNCSITFQVDQSGLGLKTLALAAADVYQKGKFIFKTAVTGFQSIFSIPTFKETLVSSGSDAINTADIDVAGILGAEEDGIVVTGGTVLPSDAREHDITALSEAREIHIKKT